jgi:hypothetical protein
VSAVESADEDVEKRARQPHRSIRGSVCGTVIGGVEFREQLRPAHGSAGCSESGRDSSEDSQTKSGRSRADVPIHSASAFFVTWREQPAFSVEGARTPAVATSKVATSQDFMQWD